MVGEFLVAAVHRGARRHLVDQAGGHQRAQEINIACVVPAEGQCQGQCGHGVSGGVQQVRVLPLGQFHVDGIGDFDGVGGGGQ